MAASQPSILGDDVFAHIVGTDAESGYRGTEEDGLVSFRPDVYGRDATIFAALQRPLGSWEGSALVGVVLDLDRAGGHYRAIPAALHGRDHRLGLRLEGDQRLTVEALVFG